MDTKIKRPATIWIAQIILALFSLLFIFSLLSNILVLINYIKTVSLDSDGFRHLLIGYSFLLGIVFIFLLLFLSSSYGMVKRRNWSRWLAVASLLIIWTLMIIAQIWRPKGPLTYYEYQNGTKMAAGFFTQLVLDGLFLLFIATLAFSKKITVFFNGVVEENP